MQSGYFVSSSALRMFQTSGRHQKPTEIKSVDNEVPFGGNQFWPNSIWRLKRLDDRTKESNTSCARLSWGVSRDGTDFESSTSCARLSWGVSRDGTDFRTFTLLAIQISVDDSYNTPCSYTVPTALNGVILAGSTCVRPSVCHMLQNVRLCTTSKRLNLGAHILAHACTLTSYDRHPTFIQIGTVLDLLHFQGWRFESSTLRCSCVIISKMVIHKTNIAITNT